MTVSDVTELLFELLHLHGLGLLGRVGELDVYALRTERAGTIVFHLDRSRFQVTVTDRWDGMSDRFNHLTDDVEEG